jgi:hypothetical protein
VSTEPSGDRVVVVTSTPEKPSFVWRRKKNAFERLGKGVEGFSFDTIDVAPSNERRLYATASPLGAGKRAHFFRSDDGGAALTEIPMPLEKDGRLYLSAIDPKDDRRVFVRQTHAAGTDLLLSTDAGATFTSVLHTNASMFGFGGDGSTYYGGSGDATEGVYRSRDRGLTWERAASQAVLCLHVDGPRLFACSNPYAIGGWAAAVSLDQGTTYKALATFADVRGPISCDAGAGALCASFWSDVRAQIQGPAHPDASPAPSEPADAGTPPLQSARRSCGCNAHGPRAAPGALAILLVVLAFKRRLDRL